MDSVEVGASLVSMVYEGDSVVEYGAADLAFTELVVEEFGDTNEMLFTDRESDFTDVGVEVGASLVSMVYEGDLLDCMASGAGDG
jgi:predicted neutral ceramidase superfamily lipid hydrolase